ncbi:MAG TPA: hypothetical protein VN257_07475, partial [Actinotalea sp.]|nr:hypothetical protein [Actinotalea sp.]
PSIGLATHETDLSHRRTTPFAAVGRFDNLMSAIRSDDFALAKLWQQRAATFTRKLRVATVLGSVERQLEEARGSVRLAGLLHRDAAEASEKLKEKGVQVSLVEVSDATEGLAFDAVPLVREGGTAVLYTRGGVVVGVKGDQRLSFRKAPR